MKENKKVLLVVLLVFAMTFIAGVSTAIYADEATYASSDIFVDGSRADIEGYNIAGNNYFKLRDLAAALSGSGKHFQVTYDPYTKNVNLITGMDYEKDGTETYEPSDPNEKRVLKTTSDVYLDGKSISLDAYNVNGYNYIKLRDVATLLDFGLIYYGATKEVLFRTDLTYADSREIYTDPQEDNPPSDDPSGDDPSQNIDNGIIKTEAVNAHSKFLTNYSQGFKVMVPLDAAVDTGFGEIRTVIENSTLRLEVYRQTLSSGYNSYINYSNKFLKDTSTYHKIYSGTLSFAGKSAHVLEWSRKPLSGIENDRCYYASVDLKLSNNEVMTFFFKSTEPFNSGGSKSYINIMNTVSLQAKTATAVNKKTTTVKNTHWNAETAAMYEEYFGPNATLKWGIHYPEAPHYSFVSLNAIEAVIGTEFRFLCCYVENFNRRSPDYVKDILEKADSRNRTLELTLQTSLQDEGSMILDALDGKYDDYLNEFARVIAEFGKPVLFRPFNEMNGDWCAYSAYHMCKDTDLYVKFYRYLYDIFEKNGALANTIWVWNPNHKSYPDYYWNHALCYYPGDEYVDVIGLTAYNTGTYYSGEKWTSFETLYDSFYYAYLAWFSQPMMITEFSCSGYGGDKVQWTKDMFAKIKDYSRIKVAIWWGGADYDSKGNIARPYYINTPEGMLEVFRENIGS